MSDPPALVRRGGQFLVTDTARNGGGSPRRPSETRCWLPRDAGKSTDRRLQRRLVPGIAAGASTACADHARRVTESSETNNCRAAATTVTVR